MVLHHFTLYPQFPRMSVIKCQAMAHCSHVFPYNSINCKQQKEINYTCCTAPIYKLAPFYYFTDNWASLATPNRLLTSEPNWLQTQSLKLTPVSSSCNFNVHCLHFGSGAISMYIVGFVFSYFFIRLVEGTLVWVTESCRYSKFIFGLLKVVYLLLVKLPQWTLSS